MVSFSPEKMEMAPSGGRETHLVKKAVSAGRMELR